MTVVIVLSISEVGSVEVTLTVEDGSTTDLEIDVVSTEESVSRVLVLKRVEVMVESLSKLELELDDQVEG